jgi:hypothetical protein
VKAESAAREPESAVREPLRGPLLRDPPAPPGYVDPLEASAIFGQDGSAELPDDGTELPPRAEEATRAGVKRGPAA